MANERLRIVAPPNSSSGCFRYPNAQPNSGAHNEEDDQYLDQKLLSPAEILQRIPPAPLLTAKRLLLG